MERTANRRLMEAFAANGADVALADDIVVRDHAQDHTFSGRAAAALLLRAFYGDGFAGARLDPYRLLLDGDAAVLEGVFQGRHSGRFLGIPPTGRCVALPIVFCCTLTGNRIRALAIYYDAGTLLRQLGLAV